MTNGLKEMVIHMEKAEAQLFHIAGIRVAQRPKLHDSWENPWNADAGLGKGFLVVTPGAQESEE